MCFVVATQPLHVPRKQESADDDGLSSGLQHAADQAEFMGSVAYWVYRCADASLCICTADIIVGIYNLVSCPEFFFCELIAQICIQINFNY